MDRITIIKPDDWHSHLRTGSVLKLVVGHTASRFGRAIVMPNLKPPVTNVERALAYRTEILDALPAGSEFQPLMTLYLTGETTPDEIRKAADADFIHAFKLYPAGATTHSDSGVANIEAVYPMFAVMEKLGMPLLIHGEVADNEYDIFDREKIFIETKLQGISRHFPELRVVLEHLTTQEAVDFVLSANNNVAATITPQHLMFNRNAILAGGIRPHYYCLPVLKREHHRLALLAAATSGNPKFFLGTDSAPHITSLKENSCGCAGCYTAHAGIELYAEVFEQAGCLDRLEGFASFFGADFYRLPRNSSYLTLQRQEWAVPEQYAGGGVSVTPLKAGESLRWQLAPLPTQTV